MDEVNLEEVQLSEFLWKDFSRLDASLSWTDSWLRPGRRHHRQKMVSKIAASAKQVPECMSFTSHHHPMPIEKKLSCITWQHAISLLGYLESLLLETISALLSWVC
jgi:hypothetical protein